MKIWMLIGGGLLLAKLAIQKGSSIPQVRGTNPNGTSWTVLKQPSAFGSKSAGWSVWVYTGKTDIHSYAPEGHEKVETADTKSQAISIAKGL